MDCTVNCDFCQESLGAPDKIFSGIYPEVISRRIAESDNLFVIPTIGQLFDGSLLVISKNHVERFSETPELWAEAEGLVNFLVGESNSKNVLIFEHGASSERGGACGIYHAHIHIVPLPEAVDLDLLINKASRSCESLFQGLEMASSSCDYLLVKLGTEIRFLESEAQGFGSQYMRRRLVDYFQLNADWNWRSYQSPEQMLLKVLSVRSG